MQFIFAEIEKQTETRVQKNVCTALSREHTLNSTMSMLM